MNVLQEIRYLAKFKSEYIVNYNHSWVQVNLEEEINDSDNSLDIEDDKVLSSQNVTVGFDWDSNNNSNEEEKYKCNSNYEDDSKFVKQFDMKAKKKSNCKVRINNKDYL